MRRAVGSWTTPRIISVPAQPGPAHGSVGAMRGSRDAGGLKLVSRIPSGAKTRSAAKRSRLRPLTRHHVAEQEEADVAVDEGPPGRDEGPSIARAMAVS
jgi:hypothetical protein